MEVPRFSSMLLFGVITASEAIPSPAPAIDPPPSFEIFLRLDRPLSESEDAAVRATPIAGFVVRADDAATLAAIRGRRVILDDVVDRDDFVLTPSEYGRVLDDYLVTRDPRFTIRAACPNREPFRTKLFERARGASAFAEWKPYAFSLALDPSWTFESAPHDMCMRVACIDGWRKSLAKRFPDASAAAAALRVEATTFAAIEPWTVDRARAWNEGLPRERVRLGAWIDFRETQDESLAVALEELAAAIPAADSPGASIGFLGGGISNPFGGHDWSRLARSLTLLGPPNDPTSGEVVLDTRGSNGPPLRVLIGLNATGGTQRFAQRHLAERFLAGASGAIVSHLPSWIERDEDGTAHPAPLADSAAKVMPFFGSPAAAEWTAARSESARTAILYSPRSLKIQWMIDAEPSGIYWPSRATSIEGELLPLAQTWSNWQALLHDMGIANRWLGEDKLDDAGAPDPLADTAVLVLPRVISLSAVGARRIREFVARGGRLIADGECALYDEYGNGLSAGRLDDLFGVTRDADGSPWNGPRPATAPFDRDAPNAPDTLRVIEPGARIDPARTSPNALYLNAIVADYVGLRDRPGHSTQGLRDSIAKWLAPVKVVNPVVVSRVDGTVPARVRLFVRVSKDDPGVRYVAMVRTEFMPEVLDPSVTVIEQEPDEFEIDFGGDYFIDDLRNGVTGEQLQSHASVAMPLEGFSMFRLRAKP